jgi:hypothetical protein
LEFIDWPAQSPDLNPIDNLSATLKRNITTQQIAKGVEDFEKQLFNEWWSIPQETINELIDVMPSRVQAVINSHGSIRRFYSL